MRLKRNPATCLAWLGAALWVASAGVLCAGTDEVKLEAQLVWGTNDSKSPDPSHKPVEPAIREKLKKLPLKWSNYFEVTRKSFTLPSSGSRRVTLSEKCAITVRNLGDSSVELSLFGKGEKVVKGSQRLPKGETFIVGGNAPDSTAWLVILKRVD